MKRKILILILIFILILPVYSFAEPIMFSEQTTMPTAPEVFAESAILLDVDSDKILYEKNANKAMYPASTTKLMTAILTMENCKDLDQKALVSYYAVNEVPYSYSIADLRPGEELSIRDLLYALLLPSANDAAYVLAEYMANSGNNYSSDAGDSNKEKFEQSLAKFSDMMNEKAKSIGCKNTHFVNPNGIHADNHVSSAYDLMLIGKEAYGNSTIRSICNTLKYSLPNTNVYSGETRVVSTTNLLILPDRTGYYEYANGLKTGFTDLAQSCIISSASKGDRNLIAVILHSDTESTDENQSRENDCKRLFEYGFNSFTNSTLISKDHVIQSVELWNGTKDTRHLDILCNEDLKTLVVNGEIIDATPEIVIDVSSAPISKGEVVGKITYNIHDETFSCDLVAGSNVIPIDFKPHIIVGLLFVVLLIIMIMTKSKKKRKKRYKYKYRK